MSAKDVTKALLIFIKYNENARLIANGQSLDVSIKASIDIDPEDMNRLEAYGWVRDGDTFFLHNMMSR